MFKKYNYLLWALAVGLWCWAGNSHATANMSLELDSIADSSNIQKYAGVQFLPELQDSENGWAGRILGGDYSKSDCAAYPLTSCPPSAICVACPFNRKLFRMSNCQSPYISNGSNCVCPSPVRLIFSNDVCTQYCDDSCVEKACLPSPDISGCTNGTVGCEDGCGGYKRKCCLACSDTVDTKPENSSFILDSCKDNSGLRVVKTSWTCNPGYHQVGYACEKDCFVTNCSGYTLSSCPAGKTCDSCTKTASNCSTGGTYYKENTAAQQKCLNEGYRLKADWPKPTAYNDIFAPSQMLANFMRNVFNMKSAHAVNVSSDLGGSNKPIQGDDGYKIFVGFGNDDDGGVDDKGVQVRVEYEFNVTATCPYDSNYVKGEWVIAMPPA